MNINKFKLKFTDKELNGYLKYIFKRCNSDNFFRRECNIELNNLKRQPSFRLRNGLLKVLIRNLLKEVNNDNSN